MKKNIFSLSEYKQKKFKDNMDRELNSNAAISIIEKCIQDLNLVTLTEVKVFRKELSIELNKLKKKLKNG